MSDQRPQFVLTLEALPDPRPAPRRLAQALKHLLRAHGLRCASAVELTPPPGPVVAPAPPAPAATSVCAPPGASDN